MMTVTITRRQTGVEITVNGDNPAECALAYEETCELLDGFNGYASKGTAGKVNGEPVSKRIAIRKAREKRAAAKVAREGAA